MQYTLRLTQHSTGEDRYKVHIALTGGEVEKTAQSEFSFSLSAKDQESIRWYLEDYPLYRFDPAPAIADRTEKRMADIGRDLFRQVFQSDEDARDLWAEMRKHLSETRVEIVTGVREAAAIPWELLRDPKTDIFLALRAGAFVHANLNPAQPFQMPKSKSGPIRILLVICRPGGQDDVPFRSVASKLIKGLADADREMLQLDVLRPPTFDSLSRRLRAAKDQGKPYHAVHFDGHGAFADMDSVIAAMKEKEEKRESAMQRLLQEIGIVNSQRFDADTVYPKTKRSGRHGYLCFENPEQPENLHFADGEDMGNLLSAAGVPVLVLNACRSAHAEAPEKPKEEPDAGATAQRDQIRAFGSLAQEIVNAGTAGVVAMRYNVYVDTAARFVADLYASLIAGNPLGHAVTQGRKFLADNPVREISGDSIAMQDWCVPVVYEAGTLSLFPKSKEKKLNISLSPTNAVPARGHLDPDLPLAPDAGFWGRDETLLAMDRAFDTDKVILLHAYAGSGKTAAAAEFARWYSLTGGVEGPVLFTSFEQYRPLARVLDKFGQVFSGTLENAGINWLALDDADRKSIALQVFQQIPLLWIWDNVEPVTGFPAGTGSAWKPEEQKDLADFLRQAADSKARFLLTSRREEKAWLRDFPRRITLPAMPMHEREQMARGLAKKQGKPFHDLKAWRPLLRFTDGNPLTLTVLVGQALRDGLENEEQIKAFTEKLQKGETAFDDDEKQGRSKSLAASLNYGFEHAFTEEERKILALLYFFQGFVDVKVLMAMGNPKLDSALPELRGMSRENFEILLNRAAEVGLLTAYGSGYYSIHPALPWFFKSLFEGFYPPTLNLGEEQSEEKSFSEQATQAFVNAMGAMGNYYNGQYSDGNRNVIHILYKEEANLLHGLRMSRVKGWWIRTTNIMQGLRCLYDQVGKRTEWKRLVEEIVPDYIDITTDAPLPGREEKWGLIMEYRVRMAMEEYDWYEAERLQTACVEFSRKKAAQYLQIPSENIESSGKNILHSLSASLNLLSGIQRKMGKANCVDNDKEAFSILTHSGDNAGAAVCALNIGEAYQEIPAIRNLEEVEKWYKRSIGLRNKKDHNGKGNCLIHLGLLAYKRFEEVQKGIKPKEIMIDHLINALNYCHNALKIIHPNAVNLLMSAHNTLGLIYDKTGNNDQSVSHYMKSIQFAEIAENYYDAGFTRYNIAVTLMQSGRIADALDYARAALRNFETYGNRAAADIENAKGLIAHLEAL
ncbi:MAG: CHAT domain-containing protein [Desulfococcaceae bacterium]